MMFVLLRLTAQVCFLVCAVSSREVTPCGNRKCLCYKDSDQLRMDCANKTIHNVEEIVKNIPENTTILDLSRNSISLLRNKPFVTCENLKHLQVLNLTDNKIKEIHEYAFTGLARLKTLDISRNYLTDITAKIPKNVRELCLNHNFITKLVNFTFSNAQIAVHKMKNLYLQNNTLKEIERYAFEGLRYLEYLNLSNNFIPFMSHGLVPSIFKPMKSLLELDIHNNAVTESSNQTYPDNVLVDAKSLRLLNMDGIANSTFGPGFQDLKNLTTLNLSGLSGHCKMHILKNDTFRYLNSVKHLDISYCDLSHIEADALSPLYQLDSIDMTGNKDLGYLALPNVFFGLKNTTAETLKYSSMFRSRMGTKLKVEHLQHFNETKLKNLHVNNNALELFEDDVLDYFPKTIIYISAQNNRMMPGPWVFGFVKPTNLEIVDISYQLPSPKIEFPFGMVSFLEKGRQISSTSKRCIDTSLIYPTNLKKVFFIGSKDEDIIPCIILNSQGTKLEEIRIPGNIFHSWQGPILGVKI